MMIGIRCRVVFFQYIPKKLTPFGIKVWVNLETKTDYVLCFQVYTSTIGNGGTTGLGYRIVMDRYISPWLLKDLLVAGTYCIGTARPNRKYFPKEVVPSESSNLPSGTFRISIGKLLGNLGEMVAVWWRDWKDVLALSTMHIIHPQQRC